MIIQRIITVILILGSLVAICLKKDLFPFSNYPMYSKILEPEKGYYRFEIIGVNQEGAEVSVAVWPHLRPFWKSSLREALLVDSNKEKVQSKLHAALIFYNQRIITTNLSPLKGLRLYRYKLDWENVVEDIKSDSSYSGNLGPYAELWVETSL